MAGDTHSATITRASDTSEEYRFSWPRPEFTAEDGIGPLQSLHQAGDSAIVLTAFDADGKQAAFGSGVMVGPGLMLTASHVLEHRPPGTTEPIGMAFLPDERARIWLPRESNCAVGEGKFRPFGAPPNRLKSDISLVACELYSDPYPEEQFMFAQLEAQLPLVGDRLWAIGFREGDRDDDAISLIPYVSSGLVTACFPHGRGSHMPSSCVEVAMNTFGGMSGGQVLNAEGRAVGIVSSSLESEDGNGPTYVTLIWDALRLHVKGFWPTDRWPEKDIDLFDAQELGLATIVGRVRKDGIDIVMELDGEALRIVADGAEAGGQT